MPVIAHYKITETLYAESWADGRKYYIFVRDKDRPLDWPMMEFHVRKGKPVVHPLILKFYMEYVLTERERDTFEKAVMEQA